MPKVHCGKKMRQVLATLETWGSVVASEVSVDAAPECEEDWGPDYAIILCEIEYNLNQARFFDVGQAQDEFRSTVVSALGPAFTVVPRYTTKYEYQKG